MLFVVEKPITFVGVVEADAEWKALKLFDEAGMDKKQAALGVVKCSPIQKVPEGAVVIEAAPMMRPPSDPLSPSAPKLAVVPKDEPATDAP